MTVIILIKLLLVILMTQALWPLKFRSNPQNYKVQNPRRQPSSGRDNATKVRTNPGRPHERWQDSNSGENRHVA
jgi:hypothetical protein